MTESGPATRRQLSLYAEGPTGVALAAIRARIDPLQHGLMPAHLFWQHCPTTP